MTDTSGLALKWEEYENLIYSRRETEASAEFLRALSKPLSTGQIAGMMMLNRYLDRCIIRLNYIARYHSHPSIEERIIVNETLDLARHELEMRVKLLKQLTELTKDWPEQK